MSWLFNGLPLHPLIVHAAVVAIPLTALLAIGAAWIARVRDWLGIVFPLIASAATVATLLAQESGEALAEQIVQTSAVTAHTGIAEIAVVAAALLLVVSWAQWVWIHHLRPSPPRGSRCARDRSACRARRLDRDLGSADRCRDLRDRRGRHRRRHRRASGLAGVVLSRAAIHESGR